MHRDKRAAEKAHVEEVRSELACVTREVPVLTNDLGTGHRKLTFPRGLVRLRGDRTLLMTVIQGFTARHNQDIGTWSVDVTSYYYGIDDERGKEILSYQWHPRGPSPKWSPHLHIGEGSGREPWLAKAHLPTGEILLVDFVTLLLGDLQVEATRPDWQRHLRGLGGIVGALSSN